MIKMSFEQKRYNFEKIGEAQNYDIAAQIEMDEDASVNDVVVAIARLMNLATYRVTINSLRRVLDDLEEEYEADERIL